MKKICLLTTCIALISTTAFAVPQTNIQTGQTAIDISILDLKDTFNGISNPSKANPDFGITVFCQVKIPEMSVRIPSFCTGNFPVLSGMGRADQETATFCRINACSIR